MSLQHFPQQLTNSLSEINKSLASRSPLPGIKIANSLHFSLISTEKQNASVSGKTDSLKVITFRTYAVGSLFFLFSKSEIQI